MSAFLESFRDFARDQIDAAAIDRDHKVPEKVVKPYPVCPRCTLDTGKISVGCAYAMVAYASTPIAAQCRTNPRMCNEHSGPVQVPPQPSLCRARMAGPGTRRLSRSRRAPPIARSRLTFRRFARNGRRLTLPRRAIGKVGQVRDNCVRFCVGRWWASISGDVRLRRSRTSLSERLAERSDLGTASANPGGSRR